MKKPIILKLKPRHFQKTDFLGSAKNPKNDGCAIEKAACEFFNTENVLETVTYLEVNNILYRHKPYCEEDFNEDVLLAKQAKSGNKIIRKIELIEQ